MTDSMTDAMLLPAMDTATTVTALDAPTAGSDEFDALVTQHVEGYRLPMGTLAHPKAVQVADPQHRPDPEAVAAIDREARRILRSFVGGLVGIGSSVGAMVTGDAGWLGAGQTTLLVGAGGAYASVIGAFWLGSHFETREMRARRATRPNMLTVPADVAAAYRAFTETPQKLRALNASESVVGAVEAQAGYAEALLAEAAALHAADASTTHEAFAVRDTLVQMAAHAQSLVVLAQRHHAMVNAAAASTPMLLRRRPDVAVLAAAAQTITEETSLVRALLDGAPDTLA